MMGDTGFMVRRYVDRGDESSRPLAPEIEVQCWMTHSDPDLPLTPFP